MSKDNTCFAEKRTLRKNLATAIETNGRLILETHGGNGTLWNSCYAGETAGVVFEHNPKKAEILALQRPGWLVINSDVVGALKAGACDFMPFTWLDIDAYGDPWPTIEALFEPPRVLGRTCTLVVTDGLLTRLRLDNGWGIKSLASHVGWLEIFRRRGYLEACRFICERIVAPAGYAIADSGGCYAGPAKRMTLWYARLTRSGGEA